MSKRKKKKQTQPSAEKSPGAPSTEPIREAVAHGATGWRSFAAEPVALGLALFVVLRPWRDGITFPGFNAYYLAFIVLLAALWCARTIIRSEPIRFPVPIAILGAFLVVGYFTGRSALSYDPAHRVLLHVSSYLLLFVLVTNGLRTRRAIQILLVSICVTWLLTAAWSVFHYFVMLRGMRQVLAENPQVMEAYFNVSTPTEALKSRLESNRAFGTFLFPNALGAFLILGIPILAVATRESIRNFFSAARAAGPPRRLRGWLVLGVPVFVGFSILGVLYYANFFIGAARPGGDAPITGTYRPFLVFAPFALVPALAAGWIVSRQGLARLGGAIALVGAPIALTVSLAAQWLSYSRGSMAALFAAVLVSALLLWRPHSIRGPAKSVAAVILSVLALYSTVSGAQDEHEGYRLPEVARSGINYSERKYIENQEALSTIDIEGAKREIADLAKLDSFRLRLTYWQVGMRMLADHPLTGVGLGNFRLAYPCYQFLGAGDVEAAHNDFLQYFCETGVIGGGLFLAFWVYFGVYGARRILAEDDRNNRLWLAALYASCLAFALHSLVDFNFQNPTLASAAFIIAGVFYAVSAQTETAPEAISSRAAVRTIAIACTVITVLTTTFVTRVYFFDLGLTRDRGLLARLYYVGDRKSLDFEYKVASEFLKRLSPQELASQEQAYLPLRAARLLIPDIAELESVGVLRVPMAEKPSTTRRLGPGEAIPENAYLFISKPRRAFTLAAEYSEKKIESLEDSDALYPHDPELASRIYSWYALLASGAADPVAKRRYAAEAESWAREATERSPAVAWWWINYAKALWARGEIEPVIEQRLAYYRKGLEFYEHAQKLYPRSADAAFMYGQALNGLGEGLKTAGRVDEGQQMVDQSRKMFERADLLARYELLVR